MKIENIHGVCKKYMLLEKTWKMLTRSLSQTCGTVIFVVLSKCYLCMFSKHISRTFTTKLTDSELNKF